jgi:thiol-disulfide isomerase/thioredoxin
VIAEYQGPGGLMTGRVETTAPDADVRIGLKRRTAEVDDVRASIRPARAGVDPISRVEESDEADEDENSGSRLNHEDIDPPAPEAEALTGAGIPGSPRTSAPGSAPGRSRGWTQRPRQAPAPSAKATGAEDADDEVNPLPPALEPENVGASDHRDDSDGGLRLARRQAQGSSADDTAEAGVTAPRPLPQGVVRGARSVSPEAYAPLSITEPDDTSRNGPARVTRPDSNSLPSRSRRRSAAASSDEPPKPTWGELTFQKQPIPLDESLQKVSRELASTTSPGSQTPRAAGTAGAPTSAKARPAALPVRTGVFCEFDPIERTLRDFQLPDSQGRMVAFHDLDADLILLDFWGTWCGPCIKSIPHLIEIQKTLGGKKMQVVGIACEDSPPKVRAAKVAQKAKQLGLNYPVLVTSRDGSCPVQDAFQIQFYPTMVLLDRHGRILWREQGATDVTLARMDRFIMRNLHRPEPRHDDASQAQLARSKN